MTTDLGVYWRISHFFLFLFFEFLFQEQWIDGLLHFYIRGQKAKAKVNTESLKNNFKPHEKTQATDYTRCLVSLPKPEEHLKPGEKKIHCQPCCFIQKNSILKFDGDGSAVQDNYKPKHSTMFFISTKEDSRHYIKGKICTGKSEELSKQEK